MPSRTCLGSRVQTAYKLIVTSTLIPAGAFWTQYGPANSLILAAAWPPAAWRVAPTRLVQGRYWVWQGCKGGKEERPKRMEPRTLSIFSGISYWRFYALTYLKNMAIFTSRTLRHVGESTAQSWMLCKIKVTLYHRRCSMGVITVPGLIVSAQSTINEGIDWLVDWMKQ